MEHRLLLALDERVSALPNKASQGDQTEKNFRSPSHTKKPTGFSESFVCSGVSHATTLVRTRPLHQTYQSISPRPTFQDAFNKRLQKYRLKESILKDMKTLNESNSQLKKDISSLKQQLKVRTSSMNEGPREKVNLPSIGGSVTRTKYRRINAGPLLNNDLVKHNKEVLINLKSNCSRPTSDLTWIKSMQQSPRLQKHFKEGTWKETDEFQFRASKVRLDKIKDELDLQMSFKYCPTCNETGQTIRLSRLSRS